MATAESVKAKIQQLIGNANAATGANDATLTTAVRTLISGYGSGGGDRTYFTVEGKKYYYIPGMTWMNFGDCAQADTRDFLINFYNMIALASSIVSDASGDSASVLTYPNNGGHVYSDDLIQSVDYTVADWSTSW